MKSFYFCNGYKLELHQGFLQLKDTIYGPEHFINFPGYIIDFVPVAELPTFPDSSVLYLMVYYRELNQIKILKGHLTFQEIIILKDILTVEWNSFPQAGCMLLYSGELFIAFPSSSLNESKALNNISGKVIRINPEGETLNKFISLTCSACEINGQYDNIQTNPLTDLSDKYYLTIIYGYYVLQPTEMQVENNRLVIYDQGRKKYVGDRGVIYT